MTFWNIASPAEVSLNANDEQYGREEGSTFCLARVSRRAGSRTPDNAR